MQLVVMEAPWRQAQQASAPLSVYRVPEQVRGLHGLGLTLLGCRAQGSKPLVGSRHLHRRDLDWEPGW